MQLFYTPDITSDYYTLNEEESRHCLKVLRLQKGDLIFLTDGLGTLMESEIAGISGKLCNVRVLKRQTEYGKRIYRLHMAVAPTKNIERFEWFLEKATEIGVDEITPLLCEHSERKVIRTERLEKVITSAVKQSLKAYHPKLNGMTSFNELISRNIEEQKIIAHLADNSENLLLKHCYTKGRDVICLIGPEGDFSPAELDAALKHGFRTASLGDSRLRTETAAVIACHAFYIINQD